MFCLPFERAIAVGGIFRTEDPGPSLVKSLNTNWQTVNLQHTCYSHKNIILNENIKPRSWHPCLKMDTTWTTEEETPGMRRTKASWKDLARNELSQTRQF